MINKNFTVGALSEYIKNIIKLDVKIFTNADEVDVNEEIDQFGMSKDEAYLGITDTTKLSSIVGKVKKLVGLDIKIYDIYSVEVDYELNVKKYGELKELANIKTVMTGDKELLKRIKKYISNKKAMAMLTKSNSAWIKFISEELALDKGYVFELIKTNFAAFNGISKLTEMYPKVKKNTFYADEEIIRYLIQFYPNVLADQLTPKSIKDEYLNSKEKMLSILRFEKVQEVGMVIYENLSQELKSDEDIISAVLQKRPSMIGRLGADKMSDPKWVNFAFESLETLCKNNPQWSSTPYIDQMIQKIENHENKSLFFGDIEWVRRYIKLSPFWIGRNISDDFKKDPEIAKNLNK